jgi:type IV pilus assembly protein PilO
MADSALARMPVPARVGISVGLLTLAGLAYYVVFYSDVAGQIESARSQRGQLETDLTTAKQAEQTYQKDLEELARRRERERELNKVLPSTTEYPAFLSAVQSVANASGVNLIAWSPEPEAKEQYYARVPMQIELSGRFHQVAKFFYGIGPFRIPRSLIKMSI